MVFCFDWIERARGRIEAAQGDSHLRKKTMASEPKRPDEYDNIVSLHKAHRVRTTLFAVEYVR